MHKHYIFSVVISLIVLSSIVQGAEPNAGAEIESCDCTQDCIEAYVTNTSEGVYTANEAERVSEHCGERAVLPLRDLLASEEASFRSKGFAALCLGKIGTADCETALLDYIQLSRSQAVSVEEYTSIQMALYGLGFIGSEEAIKFLRLLCSEEYWLNRDDIRSLTSDINAQGRKKPKFEIETWRSSALAGIEVLAPEKAQEVFQLLRADETYEALFPSIDSAIAALNKG